MFVEAIKKSSEFTRPIHIITREYGSELAVPGAATMFFVNELGHAITCKHVAEIIAVADQVNKKYLDFKKEKDALPQNKVRKKTKELEQKYGYAKGVTIQIKNRFIDSVDKFDSFEIVAHPTYDLALIKFNGYSALGYTGHAVFLKDDTEIQQGRYLCRLGYPFPEFTNYTYNQSNDDIEWTQAGQAGTPRFPIDGIITRYMLGLNGEVAGIEMSTPGLKGQSGGPLFAPDGKVYGMQSMTHHLHLGFDIKEKEILDGGKKKKVSNHPFLHLGSCVHVNVIKSFLTDNGIKFYEE